MPSAVCNSFSSSSGSIWETKAFVLRCLALGARLGDACNVPLPLGRSGRCVCPDPSAYEKLIEAIEGEWHTISGIHGKIAHVLPRSSPSRTCSTYHHLRLYERFQHRSRQYIQSASNFCRPSGLDWFEDRCFPEVVGRICRCICCIASHIRSSSPQTAQRTMCSRLKGLPGGTLRNAQTSVINLRSL